MTIIEGRGLGRRMDDHADVVIVGSGAGGAPVAQTLAEAGLEVIVLEEGPHVPGEVYGKLRPTESLRKMGREAGTTAVVPVGDTPLISVMAGRVVGGSSVMTGGVCFRTPGYIHDKWVKEHNLPMLSQKDLEPAFEAVERDSHVETVPEHMRSRSTQRFAEGANKLGVSIKSMRRNTRGCNGCSRCNFGCPHGAKMSVDRTYLPAARRAGARIYSDCLVERIITRGGKTKGVRGRLLGPHKGRFEVRANTVVIAAGSLHTPLLLMRSGFKSKALGRHLTLHPAFRCVALFEDQLHGWRGALQSAYSDHFEREGITLNSVFVPPNVLAAGLPGVGSQYAKRVGSIDRLAVFGGQIHDGPSGRIWRTPGREPLITYRMNAADRSAMFRTIEVLAECFLAAGAQEVYLPVFGSPPIRDKAGLRAALSVKARQVECLTFHPLGTARIAREPRAGAVDPWGRSYELEGLVVVDGSIMPTSIGVNSQLTIMAMAQRIAWRLREDLKGGRPQKRGPPASW